ncbi:unnamed protein product [Heterobilharzia americana]|nr:unnamed protein product [Heterobilharzia americana]
MNPQYDSALLGILQHEGKLEKFLDVIFGFLMRRTDFFYIMTPEQKKLGFPNGVSIQMVLKAYEKYKTIFEGYQHLREESPTNLPTKNQEAAYRKDLSESGTTRLPSDGNGSTCENALEVKNPVPETEAQDNDVPSVYQADADSYNGATRDNYTWSQSVKDIDIKIKTPESVINARDVSVNVERKRIRISIRQNGQETPYFDRNLCWDIHRDNAVWTFHPKENQIHLCLDKVQERWWEAAFDGEAKINTRKLIALKLCMN